jgi:hypothetical protein
MLIQSGLNMSPPQLTTGYFVAAGTAESDLAGLVSCGAIPIPPDSNALAGAGCAGSDSPTLEFSMIVCRKAILWGLETKLASHIPFKRKIKNLQ